MTCLISAGFYMGFFKTKTLDGGNGMIGSTANVLRDLASKTTEPVVPAPSRSGRPDAMKSASEVAVASD